VSFFYLVRSTRYSLLTTKNMSKIEFYKLQASGNDFILIDAFRIPHSAPRVNYKKFAKNYCSRKFGVGGDGLLVIEPSRKADFKMRIFNPDGSEPEMCGNGARCAALYSNAFRIPHSARRLKFETKAGIIESEVRSSGEVRIKLSNPFDLKLDLPLNVSGRKIKVNYVNTGVPHTVIFVQSLEEIDVDAVGREIRLHKRFQPAGTNVNFVEVINRGSIEIRTYERGVEAETLACGTGVVASAIITNYKLPTTNYKHALSVLTKSGEVLKVYFDREDSRVENVWLEGEAYLVYKGEVSIDTRCQMSDTR